MVHTPYGYRIVGGKAVIDEEQATNIRRMCEDYLAGKSLVKAAVTVGLNLSHTQVKRLIQNPRYLGDEFYPAILSKEMAQKIETERARREKALGRDGRKKRAAPAGTIFTKFSAPKIAVKYKDPVRQAEYAYSMIHNER
jgi:hypothetical protein